LVSRRGLIARDPGIISTVKSLSTPALRLLIGIGFAFQAPAWSAIVPDLVTNEDLPSAATLGGLQLNVSGLIGPALGGVLLYLLGANWVFAINALCFLVVILALFQWKGPEAESGLALESFLESFSTAVRYVRYSPAIQVVLARNILFAFFISVIPALLPVLGMKELRLQPCSLGLLFTSMGIGSVFSAVFVLPRARERLTSNTLIVLGNLLVVLVYLLMALIRQRELFLIVAALAGAGWTLSASELWVAGQRAMPSWARGRMNAAVIMASQGAIALGGIVWGFSSQAAGVNVTLVVAALTMALSLLLAIPLSINFTTSVSFDSCFVDRVGRGSARTQAAIKGQSRLGEPYANSARFFPEGQDQPTGQHQEAAQRRDCPEPFHIGQCQGI